MACLSNQAVTKNCGYLLGGLARLWYINYSELSGTSINATGTLTGLTYSGSAKFYEVEFEENTGSFVDELVVSNGNRYIRNQVGFTLTRKDATVIDISDDMNVGRFAFVVQDRAGARYLLGRTNGMTAVSSALSSGAAPGDVSGWVASFEGFEPNRLCAIATTVTLNV